MKINLLGETPPASTSVLTREGDWAIPEELPIAFVYNRRNYAVMMGTPADLADFALGFSLSEELIRSADDIQTLDIHMSEQGADLRFKLAPEALEIFDVKQRRRSLVGPAGCGLCGLENAETLFRKLPVVAAEPISLDDTVLIKAMKTMRGSQPLGNETRSTHAAAWVSPDGDIQIVREDVGRHNALDKLIGAMAFDGTHFSNGFVLMSSRCSYEIVEKAARAGVRALLCISAPTALALRKAKAANMAIYVRSGQGIVRLI